MSVSIHAAVLTAVTVACFFGALGSVDFNAANAQAAFVAPEMETARGWPYFDPSWRIRGDDRQAARIVNALPADVERDRRNAALLSLATK